MGDALRDASAWLEGKRHECFTSEVTYVRGGVPIAVKATIGRTEFELRDDYGGVERVEARDYLVRASDLTIDGSAVSPRPGRPGARDGRHGRSRVRGHVPGRRAALAV